MTRPTLHPARLALSALVVCAGCSPTRLSPDPAGARPARTEVGGFFDFDEDGVGDLAIAAATAPSDDGTTGRSNGEPDYREAGRIYVYRGSESRVFAAPTQLAVGWFHNQVLGRWMDRLGPTSLTANGVRFSRWTTTWLKDTRLRGYGTQAVAVGDLDGDGIEDVAQGGHLITPAYKRVEAVSIFSGPDTTPRTTITAPEGVSEFATFVFAAGDLDGDGFDDLLASGWYGAADHWPETHTKPLSLFVYFGSETGVATAPGQVLRDALGTYLFDYSTPNVGHADLDGDGFEDLISGDGGVGSAYVFRGAPGGPASTPDLVLHEPAGAAADPWDTGASEPTLSFGRIVDAIGDVNGDGRIDVAAAADDRVYVFLNSEDGLPSAPSQVLDNPSTDSYAPARDGFGSTSLSGGSDLDGDGFDDVVIGAQAAPTDLGSSCLCSVAGRGRAYVYWGGEQGLAFGSALESPAPAGGWMFGYGAFGDEIVQ